MIVEIRTMTTKRRSSAVVMMVKLIYGAPGKGKTWWVAWKWVE